MKGVYFGQDAENFGEMDSQNNTLEFYFTYEKRK